MLKHSLRYSEAVSIKSSIELYYTAILAVLKKNAQDCLWQSLARNAHLFLPSQLAGCRFEPKSYQYSIVAQIELL